MHLRTIGVIFGTTLPLVAPTKTGNAQEVYRPANAVTVFGAHLTSNHWEDFLTPTDIRLRQAYLAGVGLAHRFASLFGALDIEVLGQVAPHFGPAHQWEFDAAVSARWTRFPWNHVVPTSVAFGLGPSYETRTPPEERALNGASSQWLAFWVFELEAGPAESAWSGVARIHHRSTAFGLFGKSGGSNWAELGVRYHF